MGDQTNIEWTRSDDGRKGATWNPLAGCEYASEGCRGCYAARDAAGRLRHTSTYEGLTIRPPGELPRFNGVIRLLEDRLDQPLRWRKPRRVFVNSMSDLFHPRVPSEFISRAYQVMASAEQHQFQVLTKRPSRMRAWVTENFRVDEERGWAGFLPNVWAGTSVELDELLWRAAALRRTPAAVRFLSLEPLLGPLPSLNVDGIHWVIVGGESGPRSRPMELSWARDIVSRCRDAGVPVFVKQLGAAWPGRHHRDLKGHDITTWPEDLRVREYPA